MKKVYRLQCLILAFAVAASSPLAYGAKIQTTIENSNWYIVESAPPPSDAVASSSEPTEYLEVTRCFTTKKDYQFDGVSREEELCESLGVYSERALNDVAEKSDVNIALFYILGLPSLLLLGLPMIIIAVLDRIFDTHIIFPAQDGKAAMRVLMAKEKDLNIAPYEWDEFENKLVKALVMAKDKDKDSKGILRTGDELEKDPDIIDRLN